MAAFATTLVYISLSYLGFNAAVYIASEVEDAENKVPKSLVAGTLLVIVLYVLLNAVFVLAPSAESIQMQGDVAAIAAESLGGSGFAMFVRATIAACLLTSVFSMMMAGPRVYSKMADDGFMPSMLRFQGETPLVATILQIGVAVLLILVSDLRELLQYLGLTLSLSAACSVCCLFLPSVRTTRPWLHPLHILPAVYVVGTVASATILTFKNPAQVLGTVLTFLVGVAAYGAVWVAGKQGTA